MKKLLNTESFHSTNLTRKLLTGGIILKCLQAGASYAGSDILFEKSD
jgi:hypothetical protein